MVFCLFVVWFRLRLWNIMINGVRFGDFCRKAREEWLGSRLMLSGSYQVRIPPMTFKQQKELKIFSSDGDFFKQSVFSFANLEIMLWFKFIRFQVSQSVDIWWISKLHEKQSWRAATDVFRVGVGFSERISGFRWHKSLHHILRLSQQHKHYWCCSEWQHCWFWCLHSS